MVFDYNQEFEVTIYLIPLVLVLFIMVALAFPWWAYPLGVSCCVRVDRKIGGDHAPIW